MATALETPVLIVGGGGAGSTSILPKAHVLNRRAMETPGAGLHGEAR